MQRSKSNEFNKEVDKTSDAARGGPPQRDSVSLRQEIREALIQGGFTFDDRLLDTEEASKVLQVSPDCFTAPLANYRSHGRSGRKPYAFPTEGSRLGFGGMSA